MPTNVPTDAASNGRTPLERRGVLVCGSGAAGIAAALAAARHGADVWLIESRARIGGTVAHALIHTLGGFFDADGRLVNDGLAAELVETLQCDHPPARMRSMGRTRVLSVSPEKYQDVVESLLSAEPQIHLLSNSKLTCVRSDADGIACVEGFSDQEPFRIFPQAAIDASGSGELVKRIDPALVEDDPCRAAGGLIVRLSCVAPGAIDSFQGLAVVRALHDAVVSGMLPNACRHAWIDRGVADDEVYLKLFVPKCDQNGDGLSMSESPESGHNVQSAAVEFLCGLPGFETARASRIGEPGVRDGGRVRGEYRLTGADLREGRRFDDVACRGSWPIEYWHPDQGLSLQYLPNDHCYDIPHRSLRVRGLKNVWVAGKCLSADHEAQASARVVGTCWAMGEAAGKAAACESLFNETAISQSHCQ
jgi:hypothetical protein